MKNRTKKLIAALAIALLAPVGMTAAFAQSRGECQRDCDEIRQLCIDACREHAAAHAAECIRVCGELFDECVEDCK